MRQAIRQFLINEISEIGERAYEPQVAGPKVQKPYLVIRESIQERGDDWAAASVLVEVWAFVERQSFQQLDILNTKIINALHRAVITENGEKFLVEYLSTAGPDYVDDEFDALTRGLVFRVFALGWLGGLTFDPDPITALRDWTTNTWPEAQTDPAVWQPSDTQPGIYWRTTRQTLVESTSSMSWLEVQISGHVVAPSASARLVWTRRVTEAIAKQRRIVLSDGSPLFFYSIAADSEADPMHRGQIALTARLGVLQPVAIVEVIRSAIVSGDAEGDVSSVKVKNTLSLTFAEQ